MTSGRREPLEGQTFTSAQNRSDITPEKYNLKVIGSFPPTGRYVACKLLLSLKSYEGQVLTRDISFKSREF